MLHQLEEADRRVVVTFPSAETDAQQTASAPLPPFPEDDPPPAVVGGMVTGSSQLIPSGEIARVDAFPVSRLRASRWHLRRNFSAGRGANRLDGPTARSLGILWDAKDVAEAVLQRFSNGSALKAIRTGRARPARRPSPWTSRARRRRGVDQGPDHRPPDRAARHTAGRSQADPRRRAPPAQPVARAFKGSSPAASLTASWRTPRVDTSSTPNRLIRPGQS